MKPSRNKLSFTEAAERAESRAGKDSTITRLQLHPNGLWTVQWFINRADFEESQIVLFEEPLNPIKKRQLLTFCLGNTC